MKIDNAAEQTQPDVPRSPTLRLAPQVHHSTSPQLHSPYWQIVSSLGVTALFLFITLPWLGDAPFYSRGGAREALVAQGMVAGESFILPSGYSGAVPSKPPLLHWCIYLFSMVMGLSEFTCRLPSLVVSALFLFGFSIFLQRRYAPHLALASALLMTLSFEWFRHSVSCRVDLLHSAMLAGGLLFGFKILQGEGRVSLLCGALCIAGAILSKGPVGVVLPFGVLLLYGVIQRLPLRRLVPDILFLVLPGIALSALWYAAAWYEGGAPFFEMVWDENVGRMLGTMKDRPHDHSPIRLVTSFLVGAFPLSIMVPGALLISNRPRWTSLRTVWSDDFSRFAVVACAVIFGFYLLPSSKRGVYLLALYPFAFFLGTYLLTHLHISKERQRRFLEGTSVALLSVAAAAVLLALLLPSFLWLAGTVSGSAERLVLPATLIRRATLSRAPTLFAASFLLFFFLRHLRHYAGMSSYLVGGAFSYLFLLLCAMSLLVPSTALLSSGDRLAAIVRPHLTPQTALFSYERSFYGVSFYLDEDIRNFEPGDTPNFPSEKALLVLTQRKKVAKLLSLLEDEGRRARVVASDRVDPSARKALTLVAAPSRL